MKQSEFHFARMSAVSHDLTGERAEIIFQLRDEGKFIWSQATQSNRSTLMSCCERLNYPEEDL